MVVRAAIRRQAEMRVLEHKVCKVWEHPHTLRRCNPADARACALRSKAVSAVLGLRVFLSNQSKKRSTCHMETMEIMVTAATSQTSRDKSKLRRDLVTYPERDLVVI